MGKGSGTGVVVPSEQYSTREGGGGTSCADVITWQGGKAAQVGEGRETGLEVRVEEEGGGSEDREKEAGAGGGTEASLLEGETKSEPGGGKADKGRKFCEGFRGGYGLGKKNFDLGGDTGETKSELGGGKADKGREKGLLTWAVLEGRQGKHVRGGETREGKAEGRARTTYTLALPPRDGSWLLACWVE